MDLDVDERGASTTLLATTRVSRPRELEGNGAVNGWAKSS